MYIHVLGPTRVDTPHGTMAAADFGGTKPRQILEILAVSAGTPVCKDLLADLLWEGRPPKCYLGTLESYVCVLRRSLGLGGGRGAGVVTVQQGYLLDPVTHPVDLTTFRVLSRRAREEGSRPEASLAALEQALDLVKGELLADEAYATWAIEERRRFKAELVSTTSLAASQALATGRADDSCRWARWALGQDRLAEHAWRVLMHALAVAGRRSEALRAYLELRDLLADELGTDPSPQTTDLYLELLRADATSEGATDRARTEIHLLVRLLRQVMSSLPEADVPRGDRALLQAATDLLTIR